MVMLVVVGIIGFFLVGVAGAGDGGNWRKANDSGFVHAWLV